MIITLDNGKKLNGSLVNSLKLRSDLSPVPVTLEAIIQVDNEINNQLSVGKRITVGDYVFSIILKKKTSQNVTQGEGERIAVEITCLLDACKEIAFVRETPIIKEDSSLVSIYRAAGAKIRVIGSDFSVPRFSCFSGFVPSYYIAQVLQEEGGLVRWKDGKLHFFRIQDFFKQKPIASIHSNTDDEVKSGFLERHEIPNFFSIASDGSFINVSKNKTRIAQYSPFKNSLHLHNMTRCLVHDRAKNVNFDVGIAAGDLIEIIGETPLVVVTAVHLLESGSDGGGSNQYTRLWLSRLK